MLASGLAQVAALVIQPAREVVQPWGGPLWYCVLMVLHTLHGSAG